jgi:hypothetical protein
MPTALFRANLRKSNSKVEKRRRAAGFIPRSVAFLPQSRGLAASGNPATPLGSPA